MATSTRIHTLSEVEFTEIIQVSHVETRLKKNFQLIVEELNRREDADTRRDSDIKDLHQQLAALKELLNQQAKASANFVTKDQQLHDRTEILKEVIERDNALRNQLHDNLLPSGKVNPELVQVQPATSEAASSLAAQKSILEGRLQKTELLIEDLKDELAKLRTELTDTNKTVKSQRQVLDEHTKQIQQLKKSSSRTKTEPRVMSANPDDFEIEKTLQDLETRVSDIEKSNSDINETIKDKEKVIQLHTKEIWDLNEKVFALDKSNSGEHKLLKESTDSITRILEGNMRPKSSANDLESRLRDLERKAELLLQNNDVLGKGVRGCEEDIESLITQMNSSRNMTSLLHGNTEDNSKDLGDKSDLRRELLLKLGDQRREYMTLIKGLMNVKNADSQEDRDRLLDETINELKHQVQKKADEQNTRKAVVFLEKKINYIFNTFLNTGEDDARIGRKNWFCLSCDHKLNHFSGKVGDHIPSPGPKGAKLSSTINLERLIPQQGGGLISSRYKSKSKLDLPTLQTTAAKRN